MTPCAPRPLDEERQKLCIKFRGWAVALARRYLRHPSATHLRGQEKDVLSAAYLGLVEGAMRWDPARGTFVTSATFWIRAHLQAFNRRGSRLLSRSLGTAVSLDAQLSHDDGNGGTLHDLVPSCGLDATESIDGACLDAEVHGELVRRKLRRSQQDAPAAVARARRDASVFVRHMFHGESLADLGRELGMTRAGIHKCVLKMEPLFDAWAASLRAESVSGPRRSVVQHGGASR